MPPQAGDAVPVAVHGVDDRAAAVLGIGSEGAVLVGPDAIPIACWEALHTAELSGAIQALVGSSPMDRPYAHVSLATNA